MISEPVGDKGSALPTSLGPSTAAIAGDAPTSLLLREGPGTRIGPYRLLQLIGEGGFGSVFMAEQEKPVARKVALKIIKLGMDTRAVIARFEAERQALAMMDHPNIARVLDAGATETGRPYFVMELCKGEAIVEYCDKNNLSIEDRLELFSQVCNAVQHAHTKGIIHRDIKPSNILVSTQDGRPHTKVIDFGIAKATASKLTEKTLFTEHKALIGTPEYMSPEQAEGSLDIDTRTDVYSLGVLLYELLTGTTPFSARELRSAAYAEVQRIIREVDPPKPSTRISQNTDTIASVAAKRHTEPKRLGTIVRGELDWIVMKALEKTRQRRYETASGLAMDIQRYLAGDAVLAAPPGRAYRLRKFVWRNRAAVTAAGLVAAALVLGVIGTTGGLVWAMREERRAYQAAIAEGLAKAEAQERAEALEKVASFQAEQLSGIDVPLMGVRLREDLIENVRSASDRAQLTPEQAGVRIREAEALLAGIDFTGMATEALDANVFQRALAAIESKFADQPLVKARLLQTVADSLVSVGLLAQANAPQDEALRIRRSALGADHPDTLASVAALAVLRGQQGKYDEAKPLFEEAIEKRRRTLGNDHPDTLTSIFTMGTLLFFQGKYDEAEAYFNEALEGRRRVLGPDHPHTLQSLRSQGSIRLAQGRLGEAEALHREAVESCRSRLGSDHPDTLISMAGLSGALKWQGKYAEAETLDRSIADGDRRKFGENHPATLTAMGHLGETLRNLGKLSEAEVLLREVMDRQRKLLGNDHPDTLVSISRMGMLLFDQGRTAEVEPYYREALEGRRRRLGNDHANTITSINNMGFLLQQMGRLDESEKYMREAVEARRRVNGDDHPATAGTLNNLGLLLLAQGRMDEAESTFRDVLERRRQVLGDSHPDTHISLQNLAMLLMRADRFAEAEQLLRECHALRVKALPASDARIAETMSRLGAAVAEQGRFAEAESMLLEAYEKLQPLAAAKMRSDAAGRITDLYEAWDRAEPGKGYDAKAAEWEGKLKAIQASTRPTTQPATSPATEPAPNGGGKQAA